MPDLLKWWLFVSGALTGRKEYRQQLADIIRQTVRALSRHQSIVERAQEDAQWVRMVRAHYGAKSLSILAGGLIDHMHRHGAIQQPNSRLVAVLMRCYWSKSELFGVQRQI